MAAWMEVAMDKCVSGKKVLSLPGRFESLLLSLAPSLIVDVSFPRDCSNIGFVGVQPWEAIRVVPRRSFAACRSRLLAAHIRRPFNSRPANRLAALPSRRR